MSVRVRCRSCDQVYDLDEDSPVRTVVCRDCKAVITVPSGARHPKSENASSPRQSRPTEIDDRCDESPPRSRRRKNRSDRDASNRSGKLLAAAIGFTLLLALIGVGLAIRLSVVHTDKPVPARESSTSTFTTSSTPSPSASVDIPPHSSRRSEEKSEPSIPDEPLPSEITPKIVQRVKKSTVFLRVTMPGGGLQGSGFFAVEPGIVITNAHVLGMLRPGSQVPRNVTVIINSGEADEKPFTSSVLAVDQNNDLAVLRVQGEVGSLPPPLPLDSAEKLTETQKVYIFGFPFAASLGKNISVSSSSVSSLRRSNGVLKKVQVNGGIHPGNSGGPITDARGVVVGVSVSIITGTTINFAIPADFIRPVVERAKDSAPLSPPSGGPIARGGEMPPVMPPSVGPGGPMNPRAPRPPSGPPQVSEGRTLKEDAAWMRGSWQSGEVSTENRSRTATVILHINPRPGSVKGRINVDITTDAIARKSTTRLTYNFALTDRNGLRVVAGNFLKPVNREVLSLAYKQKGDQLVISGSITLRGRVHNLSNVAMLRISATPDDKSDDEVSKGDGKGAPPPARRGGDPAEAIRITGEVFTFIEHAQLEGRLSDVDVRGYTRGKSNKDRFRDLSVECGVLIGFQLGLGKLVDQTVIKSLRPIYRTRDGEKFGKWYGKPPSEPVTVKAKPEYVVSGMSVRTSLGVDGLKITFARLTKGGIDLADNYTSRHIGGETGSLSAIGGKGQLFVGMAGYLSPDGSPCALGLVAVLP